MKYTRSKKIKTAYEAYLKSKNKSLKDVYNKYSEAKEIAWEFIKCVSVNLNGTQPYILTHNKFKFTAGFCGEYMGEEIFVYVTPTRVYYCNMADLD